MGAFSKALAERRAEELEMLLERKLTKKEIAKININYRDKFGDKYGIKFVEKKNKYGVISPNPYKE